MKIKDLISKLSECDEELEVFIETSDCRKSYYASIKRCYVEERERFEELAFFIEADDDWSKLS